jgi:hypothetical protein
MQHETKTQPSTLQIHISENLWTVAS